MKQLALIAAMFVSSACASAPAPARTPGVIPPVNGEPRTLSGIRVIDITTGTGTPYAPRKCIFTHYTGWLSDSTKFDSSRDALPSGAPVEPVVFVQGSKRVMDGWEVGFEGMRVGGKRRLFIPWQLGYGAKGNPPVIPPRANLVFDVELMAVADTLPRAGATRSSAGTLCPTWSMVSTSG
jgi:peptidylprolyl isomerase